MLPSSAPALETDNNTEIMDLRTVAVDFDLNHCRSPKHNPPSTAPVAHPEHRSEYHVELPSLQQPGPLQEPSSMSTDEDLKTTVYPYQPLQPP